MIAADLVALPSLLWLSMWVAGAQAEGVALGLAAVAGFVALLAFGWLGLYRTIVRVMDIGLVMAAVRTLLPCAVFVGAVLAFAIDAETAVRTGVAFLALGLVWVTGSRFAAGSLAGVARPRGERVVVYGDAYEAARLAALIRGHGSIAPVALVDDNPDLVGHSIDGFEVHRSSDLPRLIDTLGPVPGPAHDLPPGRERRRVMERLAPLPVRVQTIPDVSKLIAGQVGLTEVSDVDVVDLLDRDPVPPLQDLLETCIRDKNVLVTRRRGVDRGGPVPADPHAEAAPPHPARPVGSGALQHRQGDAGRGGPRGPAGRPRRPPHRLGPQPDPAARRARVVSRAHRVPRRGVQARAAGRVQT